MVLLALTLAAFDAGAREPSRLAASKANPTTRTGAAPRAVRRTGVCDTLPPLRLRFRFGTGSRPVAVPTLGKHGEVYVGTADGIVHALRADGSYHWSYTLRGPVTGRLLVVAEGRLLVPTARSIYAIHADGRLAWVFHSPVELQGDLVRDGQGRVRFASADGRLFEFSERGALVRNVRAQKPWSALPVALPDGSIAGGSASGLVLVSKPGGVARFELNEAIEQVLWCPGARLCAVAGGRLEILEGDGAAFRLPARRAAARGDRLAVLSAERTLAVYEGVAAKRVFSVTLPDAPSGSPAFDARGRLYVPLMSGALLALDSGGKPLGCEQIGRSQLATPVLTADDTVLVSAREGLIAAVSPE
jgi:outer membrane protein assembly factor BamB